MFYSNDSLQRKRFPWYAGHTEILQTLYLKIVGLNRLHAGELHFLIKISVNLQCATNLINQLAHGHWRSGPVLIPLSSYFYFIKFWAILRIFTLNPVPLAVFTRCFSIAFLTDLRPAFLCDCQDLECVADDEQ